MALLPYGTGRGRQAWRSHIADTQDDTYNTSVDKSSRIRLDFILYVTPTHSHGRGFSWQSSRIRQGCGE